MYDIFSLYHAYNIIIGALWSSVIVVGVGDDYLANEQFLTLHKSCPLNFQMQFLRKY